MSDIRHKIEVMQAYESGEEIECKGIRDGDDAWGNENEPIWDWYGTEYRVKPKERKLYKWAYINSTGKWVETENFHDDTFLDEYPHLRPCKRLDYSMIEVD